MGDRLRHVIGAALDGTGLNVFGSAPIEAYDARAPVSQRSQALMPRARGVLVVGSAGRALWADFRREIAANPACAEVPHPLDDHAARALDRADVALARAGVGSRRFEPTLRASPALDFRALGEIAGLGEQGPFGMLIHATHGPWWALRGAWLVDVPVSPPIAPRSLCAGCAAPCVGGVAARSRDVALATPEVRGRCVIGQDSRYDADQIAYHYGAPLRTS